MQQVLFGLNPLSPTGTDYSGVMGHSPAWGTEAALRAPWPAAGVLRNLVVEIANAPGAGTSRTFTLRKAGADTTLTVTISDTATTARITGLDVAVAVGDLLALQATAGGAPATATAVRWSLEFEGTTANESGYSAPIGATNATARSTGVFAAPTSIAATAANARNVVAAAGTLTGMVAAVNTAPGASNGFTFYVNHNGVRQDGSGGTVNTACALIGAITSATASYSLPLAAGDLVYTEAVPTGTFTTRNWALGTRFVATTDGESHLCGVTVSTLSTTLTQFTVVPSASAGTGTTETSFPTRSGGAVTSVVLTGLRVLLNPAPGAGKSRLIDLRVNGASAGPTVTVSDTATTASDPSGSATVADGQFWQLRHVPTSTPTAAVAHWGLIQYVAPPVIPPAAGLVRVQASATTTGYLGPSVTIPFVATVGNGLVVVAIGYGLGGTLASCTDTQGNLYALAASQKFGTMNAGVFYCSRVARTDAALAITVNATGGDFMWVAQAVEYSGVNAGLVVDQSAGATGTSATPGTGTTAVLAEQEHVLAACCAIAAVQGSITVPTVAPPWVQEFESLSFAFVPGEADTRVIPGTAMTTPSLTWTGTASAIWAAVLVAFKATGLAYVQASAKASATHALDCTFTIPTPAVGNGLIICANVSSPTYHAIPKACTDNRGHRYWLAAAMGSPLEPSTAVFYLPKVEVNTAPFTVRLTAIPLDYCDWIAQAIEVTGVGSGGLLPDQVSGATGTSATPGTGVAPALTADDVIEVATLAINGTHASITVAADTPTWSEQLEHLADDYIASEFNARLVRPALSTAPFCNWTASSVQACAALLVAFKSTAAVVPPTPLPGGFRIAIAGADKTFETRVAPSVTVEYELGARARAAFEVLDLDSYETAYRPQLDDRVVVFDRDNATILFAGNVWGVQDGPLGEPGVGTVTRIEALDDWRYASQVHVSRVYPVGPYSLRIIVFDLIVTYLGQFGLTYDPTMEDGPTMDAMTFDLTTVEETFQHLAELTGWVYRLTSGGIVQWFPVGPNLRPITLSADNSNILGPVRWARSRNQSLNRVIVRYGSAQQISKRIDMLGDGATAIFPLTYPVVMYPNGVTPYGRETVREQDAAEYAIGVWGVDTGLLYYYDVALHAVRRADLALADDPLPVGWTAWWEYVVQFPLVVTAETPAAATAPAEEVFDYPEVFDEAEAQAIADRLLVRFGEATPPRFVTLKTRAADNWLPGDRLTLDVPSRTLPSAAWMVTTASLHAEVDQELTSTLTLIEGGVTQRSWLDYWRQKLGTAGRFSSGSVIPATPPPAAIAVEPTVLLRKPDEPA